MAVATRVIPCLDVDNGRVVKGVNFENLRDAGDPVELAKLYGEQGADELTFLDVTASKQGRGTMLDVVRRTADQVFIPLTVGGGVRTEDDVRELLRAGADKVSVNTAAISRPELLRELSQIFGAQCIVLSVDARRVPEGSTPQPSGFEVTTHGGTRSAGLDAIEWARTGEKLGVGDPAQFHGRRWNEGRLRSRAHRARPRGRLHPCDRFRRCWPGRAFPACGSSRGGCGAGRFHLPLP